jgi:hypothetical protein
MDLGADCGGAEKSSRSSAARRPANLQKRLPSRSTTLEKSVADLTERTRRAQKRVPTSKRSPRRRRASFASVQKRDDVDTPEDRAEAEARPEIPLAVMKGPRPAARASSVV